MKISRHVSSEGGTSLIETALILPLWLAVLLIFIWLAYMQNAKQCLNDAVTQATRLAFTRGNLTPFEATDSDYDERYVPMGDHELYRKILLWQESGSTTPSDQELFKLLVSPGEDFDEYRNHWDDKGELGDLKTAHPAYIMGIIYANEAMRIGVGASVRYPCDPHGSGYKGDDPQGGSGCLRCVAVAPQPIGATIGNVDMICNFQPATFLLRPIVRLLGVVTGSGNGVVEKLILASQAHYGSLNDI